MPFSSSSWRELKDQGRDEYEKGHYEEALRLYEQAKSSCSNRLDRQMLLSNIVACRLNLGQNQQALIDAKECVRLNPSWSKGHVRLASAYIANHASNDACNALQTALRHDPSNATARQMLLQQLQRDRRGPMNNDDSDRRTTASSSSGPDPVPSTQTHNPRNHDVLDDAISWNDRIHATIGRWNRWYTSQSEHRRTGFKVLLAMILIYVSFGGRFGLGSSSLAEPLSYHPEDPYSGSRRRRNEDSRYYDDAPRQRKHYDASFDSEDSYRRQNRYSYGYDSYRSSSSRRRQQQQQQSFGGGYSGGSYGYAGDSPPWQLILIFCGLAYLCHMNGINPLPLAMMLLRGGGHLMMYHGRPRRLHRRRGRMGWY